MARRSSDGRAHLPTGDTRAMSADARQLTIEPRRPFQLLDWREIAEYRDLMLFLAWRDVAVRYKQSVLGYLWAFLQPLAQVVVLSVIFGALLGVSSGDVPYPLFALSGVVAWTYFSNVAQQGANSLVAEQGVITKVYFPRILVPLTPCIASLVDLLIALSITIVAAAAWTGRLHSALVWLPFYGLLLITAAFGTATLLAALNVRYRDVRQGTSLLLQLGLYLTPVIWPMEQMRHHFPRVYWLLGLNPLATVIQGFRAGLLGSEPAPGPMLALSVAAVLGLLVVGLWYFHRVEDIVADIV